VPTQEGEYGLCEKHGLISVHPVTCPGHGDEPGGRKKRRECLEMLRPHIRGGFSADDKNGPLEPSTPSKSGVHGFRVPHEGFQTQSPREPAIPGAVQVGHQKLAGSLHGDLRPERRIDLSP
jgi:hypothetical protein